ncbi:MAG TPA: DUF3224 domain-containing protein [Xanthomonadales bacterium]|nr:DUF3224 domain-containing protein [Xanthomonadales bacterium]
MQFRNTSLAIVAALAAAATTSSLAEEKPVTHVAEGPFEVEVIPQPRDAAHAAIAIDRLLLEKRYRGALDASGRGQMLGVHGEVETSGGYVAIERVDGTLDGRRGAFALQHSGTMTKATGYALDVAIVPDSGTGELTGIAGRLTIRIAPGGAHAYRLDYTLPDTN